MFKMFEVPVSRICLIITGVKVSPLSKMWIFNSPVFYCSFLHVVIESRDPCEDQCAKEIPSIKFFLEKLVI